MRCRARTLESYAETVDRYLVPEIGNIRLAKLEPSHVSMMVSRLIARGTLSPSTVAYARTVLRIALGRALKLGLVRRNAAALADAPTRRRVERRPLTVEEARLLLASVADQPIGPLVNTALATGMRQGELLALRWEDVDIDAGVVTVKHTLTRGTRQLAMPKTDRARRTLRLGPEFTQILRDHRVRQLEDRLRAGSSWQDGGFVFTTPRGRPWHARNVSMQLQKALIKAQLPHQRFHDLRHAYATLMLEAGEDLSSLSRSLGHANLSTTADIYAHHTPSMAERSADRIQAILGRRSAV